MIRRLVVDASVAVKWLLPEEGSEQALALLETRHELYAPDLLASEIGNVLWKTARKSNVATEAMQKLLNEFLSLSIRWVAVTHVAPLALEIARRFDRSFYDSAYLALAQSIDGTLVTADARFANALAATPLTARIITLDDLTAAP